MNKMVLLAGLFFTSSFAGPSVDPTPTPVVFNTAGQGNAYVLYRGYKQRTGRVLQAMSQGRSSSCVGCATAKALEIMHGIPFSPEWAYAISRDGHYTRGGGSWAGWAAHAAREHGMLPAADYSILGEDHTHYSVKRANDYGIRGPPDHLRAIAKLYRSPGYYKIRSWEQLRGAISQGFPVIIGSNVSFGPRRGQVKDRDGTLNRRWWGKWNHSMVFIGVDDRPNKKAALLMNSWGKTWVSGPKRFKDEPAGCFWADKSAVVRMIDQGDCYVIRPIPGL